MDEREHVIGAVILFRAHVDVCDCCCHTSRVSSFTDATKFNFCP